MKYLSLKIENFGSIKKTSFDLSKNGLVLFKGSNLDDNGDPNGAGKSMAVDALVWCLFGETTRGVRAEGVVPWWNKKALTRVMVTIEHMGKTISITRTRNPNDLYTEGDLNLRGSDVTDTSKKILDFLGISLNTFLTSFIFPQESRFDKFLVSKDTKRKEVLTQMMGMERFDCAVQSAKDKEKKVNVGLVKLMTERNKYADKTDDCAKKIQKLITQDENYQKEIEYKIKRVGEREQMRINKIKSDVLLLEESEKSYYTQLDNDLHSLQETEKEYFTSLNIHLEKAIENEGRFESQKTIDIDAIQTSAAKGLTVYMAIRE